jgi:hypothetical protein
MPDEGDDAETWEVMDRESRRLAVRSVMWCLIYLAGAWGWRLLHEVVSPPRWATRRKEASIFAAVIGMCSPDIANP